MNGSDLDRADVVVVEVGALGVSAPVRAALRISILDGAVVDVEQPVLAFVELSDWDGTAVTAHVELPGARRSTWTVFAHAGATGEIRPGDWLTTTSYPITARRVAIALDRV